MILSEKYAPKRFEDVIGLDASIPELVKKELPNFLFFGSAGTGKSTTALIIGIEHDFIKINASDDRGIDAIREKVRAYASTKSIKGGKKVIILDEADGLTASAQEILRGVIDSYSHNCAFILTCNLVEKIIQPLRSRCVNIEFKKPKKEQIFNKLKDICEKEKIEYNSVALKDIIETNYPDIRASIKSLEVVWRKFGKITEEKTKELKNKTKQIIEFLKQGKYAEAIDVYQQEFIDEERLMIELSDELFYGEFSIEQKKKSMTLIGTAYFQMSRVITKKIIIRPFLLQLMEVLKK
jgi:replication factor C small subunit